MRSVAAAAVAAAAVAAGAPAPARASGGAWSSATGSVEVDDNLLGVSDDEERIAGVGIRFTPALRLWYELPRVRLLTGYAHSTVLYPSTGSADDRRRQDSSADVLDAAALVTLSPRDNLRLALSVQRAAARQALLGAPQGRNAAALSTAQEQFVSAGLAGAVRHELSPFWTLDETLTVRVGAPLASNPSLPLSVGAGLTIGPQAALGAHGVGVQSLAEYNHRATTVELDAERPDHQLVLGSLLRWRWDVAASWSTELAAGVGIPFTELGAAPPDLLLGAALRYFDDGYSATLEYNRRFDSNPLLGQLFHIDEVRLSGALPLWREGDLSVRGATALGVSRSVGEGEDDRSFKTWVTDAAVAWSPVRLPLSVTLRYQHQRQFDAPETSTVANLHRNLVALSVSFVYPAGAQPLDVQGLPQRVDGNDAPSYQPPPEPPVE